MLQQSHASTSSSYLDILKQLHSTNVQTSTVTSGDGHTSSSSHVLDCLGDSANGSGGDATLQQHNQSTSFDLTSTTCYNESGIKHYECPVCGKRFLHKSHFRHHYMVHTGEKPYACAYCSFQCRQIGVLNRHIKTKHSFKPIPSNTDLSQI